MGEVVALSSTRFYEEAKKMLEEKDLLGFIAKINVAIEFAMGQKDEKMIAKSTYLQATGLYDFGQHKKALESVNLALLHNKDRELFDLKNIMGKINGFLGDIDQAVTIFKELIEEATDQVDLAKLYINISWALLSLNRDHSPETFQDAKTYLDKAIAIFDVLPNRLKLKVYNNYSVYYYYLGEYDQAIEILESAVQYCEEKDLILIYENLADIYLKLDDEDVSHTIDQYMQEVEVIATKCEDNFALARAFYIKAMSEVKEEQFFTALDTLYLSLEYFKKAEAYPYAFDCIVKINELMNGYKVDRLKSLKNAVQADFEGTAYYGKL